MQPHTMSPDNTDDEDEEQERRGFNRTATLLPLPPLRDINATLASTLAQLMDAK